MCIRDSICIGWKHWITSQTFIFVIRWSSPDLVWQCTHLCSVNNRAHSQQQVVNNTIATCKLPCCSNLLSSLHRVVIPLFYTSNSLANRSYFLISHIDDAVSLYNLWTRSDWLSHTELSETQLCKTVAAPDGFASFFPSIESIISWYHLVVCVTVPNVPRRQWGIWMNTTTHLTAGGRGSDRFCV